MAKGFFHNIRFKFGCYRRRKVETPTMSEFSTLFSCVFEEDKEGYISILNNQPRPESIGGHPVPKDLNALSYGDLIDLQMASQKKSESEAVAETIRIICGASAEEMANEDVNKVFGFVNWATSELSRINRLFKSIRSTYEAEEIEAGVKQLNFGAFGVLDWYAKRMGIANQNDVRDVAWVRVYTCMKMDNEKTEYERRLRKIYNAKHK